MKKHNLWIKNRLTGQNVWINLLYCASWYVVYTEYPSKLQQRVNQRTTELGQNCNVETIVVGKIQTTETNIDHSDFPLHCVINYINIRK